MPQREPQAPLALEQRGLDEGALDERVLLAEMRLRLLGSATQRPKVGRYLLCERIGQGAQAVVYRGHDPVLDRSVAIKVFADSVRGQDVYAVRHEAQALARLAHPNVVQVFDRGMASKGISSGDELNDNHGREYLVMELVEGRSLAAALRLGTLDRVRAREVFDAAAAGLAAAHAQGILHRDFKPSNVLLADEGRVQVADFGLAVTFTSVGSDSARGETTTVGTLAYMSPEQHRGERLDAKSDQYSFCVALYEATRGRRPFAGDSACAQLKAKSIGPGASVGPFAAVLRRGLSPAPSDRFESMAALRQALACDGTQPRSSVARVLAMAGVAAGLVFALAMLVNDGVAPPAHDAAQSHPRRAVEAHEHLAVWSIRAALYAVRGLVDAGRYREAAAIVEPAAVLALRLSYEPAQAQALRQLGALQGQLGDPDRAYRLLQRAYFLARRSGDDAVAREAAIELVYVEGIVRGNHREGLLWADHAAALVRDGEGARVYLRTRLGQLQVLTGDFEAAQANLQWVQHTARERGQPKQYAFATAVLCRLHLARGALPEAERACDVGSYDLTAEHPSLAYVLEGVAQLHFAQGDLPGAELHLRHAVRVAMRTRGPQHPKVKDLQRQLMALGEPGRG